MELKKTKWYPYRELCKIAKKFRENGIEISGRSLCDRLGKGNIASGGYGCNIEQKLKSLQSWGGRGDLA